MGERGDVLGTGDGWGSGMSTRCQVSGVGRVWWVSDVRGRVPSAGCRVWMSGDRMPDDGCRTTGAGRREAWGVLRGGAGCAIARDELCSTCRGVPQGSGDTLRGTA